MAQYKWFCLIIVAILLSSCSEGLEFTYTGSFPDAEELQGERILEQEFSNLTILSADSVIVLTKMRPPYFKVIDTDFNLLAEFGESGEGPGEMNELPYLLDIYRDSDRILGLIYLNDRHQFMTIDISASTDLGETVVARSGRLPSSLMSTQFQFLHPDGERLIGIYDDRFNRQLDERRGVYILEPEEGEYQLVELHNLSIFPFDTMAETNLNAKVPAISQEREKAVMAGRFYPTIEIIDLNSNEVVQKYSIVEQLPAAEFGLEEFQLGEVMTYYNFVAATEEYIFLLYEGVENRLLENPQKKWIQVLDWQGTPVHQFLIPEEYDIHRFTLDIDSDRIFAISHTQDAIYSFNLPSGWRE